MTYVSTVISGNALREEGIMASFEEVKISQERNGVLLTSFYIFLQLSIPFRCWCYLKHSPSGLGCELFNYL